MPRTPTRPGSITFVAIVLIILGSLSLLGGLVGGLTMAFVALSPEPQPRPAGQPGGAGGVELQRMFAKEVPSYYPVISGLMVMDLLFGIGQIVCGVGLLKMNASRRIAAVLTTLGKLLFSFANHAYQLLVLGPVMEHFFEANLANLGAAGQPPPMPCGGIGAIMQALTTAGVAIGAVIQLAVFLTIALILTSSGTKAAFAAAAAPLPDEGEQKEAPRRSRYEGYDDDDDLPPQAPPGTGITDRS